MRSHVTKSIYVAFASTVNSKVLFFKFPTGYAVSYMYNQTFLSLFNCQLCRRKKFIVFKTKRNAACRATSWPADITLIKQRPLPQVEFCATILSLWT